MTNYIRRLKRLRHFLAGRELYPRLDRQIPQQRLGSDYGGWHLATQYLDPQSIVYSAGVGKDISFDLQLIKNCQVKVHAFDPTPGSIQWIKSQQLPEQFVLSEVGLADFDGNVTFHPPGNPDHISHTLLNRSGTAVRGITVPVKRLESIMDEFNHNHIDLLKMDIEGAEYQVIGDLAMGEVRPGQLLIEFHHRFPEIGASTTKQALRQLRSIGYLLYAVSASGEEYSFIHTRLID